MMTWWMICDKRGRSVNVTALWKHMFLPSLAMPSADTNVLWRWTGGFHDRSVFIGVIDGHLETERVSVMLRHQEG